MAHKGFRNGRRIAEVKGASMIVALATSGVQAVRNTTISIPSVMAATGDPGAAMGRHEYIRRGGISDYLTQC
jgi:ABC-type uncharacterized transport system substrate-binding protein